jgi:glycosyltransferase involved in cell wall biosynthesis
VKTRHVIYVGYELLDGRAPHQAMGAVWLALNDYSVTYLTFGTGAQPRWLESLPSMRYRSLSGSSIVAALKLAACLAKMLVTGKASTVYVQGAQQCVVCAWIPIIFPNVTLVYHTQDFKPNLPSLYSRAERWIARRARLVICNEINRAKVMQLKHGLGQTPQVIRTSLPAKWPVPECQDQVRDAILSTFCTQSELRPVLISAGGPYMPRRRSDELIQALALLPHHYKLVFTGMDEHHPQWNTCRRRAHELGLEGRISFLPRLSYSELLSLYAASDVGMLLYSDDDLANFYQGPGRVTEYLKAGIPFVTSNFPGLELLVVKYGLGSAVDPADPASIARGLQALELHEDSDRTNRSKRLRELAYTTLAYEHDAKRVFNVMFSSASNYYQHPFWEAIREPLSIENTIEGLKQ